MSDLILSVTRRFAASPERVFDAWLDPASARRWLFATETGQMVRYEVDARIGGKFTFSDRRDGKDIEHTGEYLEIDRPRRLAFTFGVPAYASDFAVVEIDIAPLPGGGCELTLVQKMKPDYIEYLEPTRKGWGTILDGLAKEIGSV